MTEREQPPIDIAIVGGGISGLYCCLQLARAIEEGRALWIGNQSMPARDLTIALFERSSSLGGRIETWSINVKNPRAGTPPVAGANAGAETTECLQAEFGPMRIEPRDQPLLENLLEFLRITEDQPESSGRALVKFPAYSAEEPTEVLFKLEGEEAEQHSLLDLLLLAIRRICELVVEDKQPVAWGRNGSGLDRPAASDQGDSPGMRSWHQFLGASSVRRRYWKGELRDWIVSLDDADYDFIRRELRINGVRLCDMGFWNLLSEVLSHLAVLRIRDWGSYYHLIGENPNAAEHLVMWLRALKSTHSLRGISGGMIRIVQELEAVLTSHGIEARFDHVLVAVEEVEHADAPRIRLHFQDRPSVEARHVILAMPQGPLQRLRLSPMQPIARELDAVVGIPLLKLFFLIDQPWWEDNRIANRFANDLPAREIFYWKSRDRTKGLVMVYTDRPALHFWEDYGSPSNGGDVDALQEEAALWFLKDPRARTEHETDNPRLWRRFVQYARDYQHHDFTVDRLIACGMRDWGRQPYGAAVHVWRPRRESWKVMTKLTAFSLGNAPPSVHVCTDAYSDHQGFIEGALRSAARVLSYFASGAASDRFDVHAFLDGWALPRSD